MDFKGFIIQKKALLVISGIIVLFSLLLIVFLFIYYKNIVKPAPEIKKPLPEELLKERENKRVTLTQFEECLNEEKEPILDVENDWKDIYYIIVKALIEKDKNICLSIKIRDGQNYCMEEFEKFMFLMNLNKDKTICQKFADSPSEYKECLGYVNKDLKYCDEIDDPFEKITCQGIILGPKECEKLSGSYKTERCINVKGKEKIERGCGEISEEMAKSLCKNGIYFLQALEKKDEKICDLIDMKTGRFTILFCRVLTGKNPQKEWRHFYSQNACYEKFAVDVARIKNDPSLCEKIPLKDSNNQRLYQECIHQFK